MAIKEIKRKEASGCKRQESFPLFIQDDAVGRRNGIHGHSAMPLAVFIKYLVTVGHVLCEIFLFISILIPMIDL